MAHGPERQRLLEAIRFQQLGCHHLGSPFYGSLLEQVAADVEAGGVCEQAMAGEWADMVEAAVVLRFLAAVHQIVLAGESTELARHYPSAGGTPGDGLFEAFLATVEQNRDCIAAAIAHPVQTNEVGRSGVLAGGFLTVARATGLPMRLLEIGASAGLNLRWDRYRYEDRGTAWGDPSSPVLFTGPYGGAPSPLVGDAVVVERRGCDVRPFDLEVVADRQRLRSYVWPDQADRVARLDAAVAIARDVPAPIAAASALAWLLDTLEQPAKGAVTVVFHSIVMQYLSPPDREATTAAIVDAGRRATAEAPLAWLRFEVGDARRATLEMTVWPGDRHRLLARAGYHGTPVTWL